jgi:hypothetical protein
MENNQLNSPDFFDDGEIKDKKFLAQMDKVFAALEGQPKTMLMVSIETGILRANICRYVAIWKKQDRIRLAYKGFCLISKHRSGFLTTNPDLFPVFAEPLNTVKP